MDIEGVGRFILGRWWRQATPQEQAEYVKLFEETLIRNLSARFGEYQGVRFSLGRSQQRTEEDVLVNTIVERPNTPAFALDWRVSEIGGQPRVVDVIAEGFDLAIQAGTPPQEQSDLVLRKLGETPQCLIGSPDLLKNHSAAKVPTDLSGLPSLDFGLPQDAHEWNLTHIDGLAAVVHHQPRLVSDDLAAIRAAALEGVGIAQVPVLMVESDIKAGRLIDVLPSWRPRNGIVHAIFPSRRGLLPSIRALLDFLADECRDHRP